MENSRPNSLLFSSELLETSHLFHSGYWKIVGLRHAIFRGALGIFRAESFHMQLLFSYEINHTVQKIFVLIFLIYLINQNILSMFQKKKKFWKFLKCFILSFLRTLLQGYEESRKYCKNWKKHSVLIFFPDTFLQKKSWPLILSFSPSYLSRKNWEKHFLRLRRCLSLKIMFFSVFPTSATWGKTQNQRSTFFLQTCQGKKSEQNTIVPVISKVMIFCQEDQKIKSCL